MFQAASKQPSPTREWLKNRGIKTQGEGRGAELRNFNTQEKGEGGGGEGLHSETLKIKKKTGWVGESALDEETLIHENSSIMSASPCYVVNISTHTHKMPAWFIFQQFCYWHTFQQYCYQDIHYERHNKHKGVQGVIYKWPQNTHIKNPTTKQKEKRNIWTQNIQYS